MYGLQETLPEFLEFVREQQRKIATHPEAHPYQFAANGRSPIAKELRRSNPHTVNLTRFCVPNSTRFDESGNLPAMKDRQTSLFELMRRWMKQRVEHEISPRRPAVPELDHLMPSKLLDLIYKNVAGRHENLPYANGNRKATDSVDQEWANHICAHVLLYREMVGIGTNHESEVYLGRKPADENSLEFAYYKFILDALKGESLKPLSKPFLKRMTFETDAQVAQRAPFSELATVQRPSIVSGPSTETVLASVRSIPESASSLTFVF